jgi:TDG/mug DNA glycosylase family protein
MKDAKVRKAPRSSDLLKSAHLKTVRDLIGPDLRLLFCGINPGLYTAVTGHHFSGPGNRFWPALYGARITPRLFQPHEDADLLELGIGITNLVSRTTARADQLTTEELVAGGRTLNRKVRRYQPRILAFVGLGAYRTAFSRKEAREGLQAETVGRTRIWLLPNPSGLNAHHPPSTLVKLFGQLHDFVDAQLFDAV